MSDSTKVDINFDYFKVINDSLDVLESEKLLDDKNKGKVSDKVVNKVESILTSITSEKEDDQKWGKEYASLNSDLQNINNQIEELFGGTLVDETLDEFFALQNQIFGQEYNLTAWHGEQAEFFGKTKTEPQIFPNIAAGEYTSGQQTRTESAGGWGAGTITGQRAFSFYDENLYVGYADRILSDPNSSEDLINQANAFKKYMEGKSKLEELAGEEIPHYVIRPGPDWDKKTRTTAREFNVGGIYGGHLYEHSSKNKHTLWDHPKMRDLEFVKKYGATSGIFGGGDPIENLAKDKGIKGQIFAEWLGGMDEAHAFAEYVNAAYMDDYKEYSMQYDALFGDNKTGTKSITLEDGTEVPLDKIKDNLSVLKKLYGDKEGIMNLLLELESTNK